MSDYLEKLREDATVGEVFEDLYYQVDEIITVFDALRIANGGVNAGGKIFPDAELYLSFGGVAEMSGNRLHTGQFNTIGLWTRVDDTKYAMVARRTYSADPGARVPSSVSGFRGKEYTGDYTLSQPGLGRIDVRLGKSGLSRVVKSEANEPIGTVSYAQDLPVKRLPVIDRQRLLVVADGIIDNIAATALIAEGIAPIDVLADRGTQIRP